MTMMSRLPVLSGTRQFSRGAAGTPAFRLYTLDIPDFRTPPLLAKVRLERDARSECARVAAGKQPVPHLTRASDGPPEQCVFSSWRYGGSGPVKDDLGGNDVAESLARRPRTPFGDKFGVVPRGCGSLPVFLIHLPRGNVASLGRPLGTSPMSDPIEQKWLHPPTS